MDGQLRGIRQSQTNPKYLHTNSTSHKWPFSAVAELIDNAYDPDVLASKLDINYESFANHPCLTFTDNGNGLDADSMHKMLSFGFSDKTDILTLRHLAVGQYGNGFKSGSMRLGRDAIVFSNKQNTKTIGFLSQTFLENIKAMTVLVMVKEIKQEHEEKQQDLTKKLAAAQQEVSDSLNKWEDSEKKAQDLNQQLAQAGNQGNVQDKLENLRVNVFNLLRTLIDQDDVNLDTYVDDSRSAQVDDIVQRVLDDNQ